MNNIKALAIDLDGTLLVGESLSERNRSAVKSASDAGLKVVIATARWRQLAERIAAEIGLKETPIIACSGAQVYCTELQSDIYDSRLPATFVEELYAICNSNRCIATATVDNHTWLKIDKKPGPEHLSNELKWVQSLPDHEQPPRIATVQGSETIAAVRALHETSYLADVNIFDSIGPSGRTVITITAKLADKGIALDKACDHLGIATTSVLAFGDAHNDIAMFSKAGHAVAMGQAADDVKASANDVTLANTEDGVAAYIETNLL